MFIFLVLIEEKKLLLPLSGLIVSDTVAMYAAIKYVGTWILVISIRFSKMG